MRKIILYSATSTDDFIADRYGQIDWLNNPSVITEGEDYGYGAFYASIDTTLMGNNTYTQIMGFGGEFPYPDKKNYVATHQEGKSDTINVRFVSGDIPEFCKKLKDEPGRDIWLVGGGKLNTTLLESGLIDSLIITKIPVALGSGIPLFDIPTWKASFRNISTKVYGKGVIQMVLET